MPVFSYRKTLKYTHAGEVYNKVNDLDPQTYPQALYYKALMDKLTGNLEQAISGFESFVEKMNREYYPDFEERDELVDQAFIESEGADLGLKYRQEKPGDYQLNKLAEPVNSEYNDYAAAIYAHDSSLMFTSGRLGSKGRGVDPRYGESFTDFYFYEKAGQLWTSPKTKEKFKIINTKWNDGVGTFNYQKDQFYFTSCNNQGGGLCKIYVSKLVNGQWQETPHAQ